MYFIDIFAPPGGFLLSEIPYTPPKNRRMSVFALPLKSKHAHFLVQNRKKLPKKWEGMRFASMVICVHDAGEVEVTELKVDTLMWFMHKKNEYIKEVLETMAEHKLGTDHLCRTLRVLHPRSPIAIMHPKFTCVYGGDVEGVDWHMNLVKSL